MLHIFESEGTLEMVLKDLATVRFSVYNDPACESFTFSNITYCVLLNYCHPIYLSPKDEKEETNSALVYGVYNYDHTSSLVHDDNVYGVDDGLNTYTFLLNTYSDPKCTYTIQGSNQISGLSLNCYENTCCPFQIIDGENGAIMKYARIFMDTHSCPLNSTVYIDRIAGESLGGGFVNSPDMHMIAVGIFIGCMLTLAIQTWCKGIVKLPDNCENGCTENGVNLIECIDSAETANVDENTTLTGGSNDDSGYLEYLSSFVLPPRESSSSGL